jgi:hypothetical protein
MPINDSIRQKFRGNLIKNLNIIKINFDKIFKDFQRFSKIFKDFQRFSKIFKDFQRFSKIFNDFQ